MAGFDEFVQLELPKRPFVNVDGQAGQVLVRSNNPLAPRELVWSDAEFGGQPSLSFTAGHDISGHRVLTLNEAGHAIYAGNNEVGHAVKIIGISTGAAIAGQSVSVQRESTMSEPSWSWSLGFSVYLGSDGYLTQTAPTEPAAFSLYIGFATSPTSILISIGQPINLL